MRFPMIHFAKKHLSAVCLAVSLAIAPISLPLSFGQTALAAKSKATQKSKQKKATSAESIAKARALAEARYASIVMDAYSGTVLQESGADKVLYPASLTKIMTLFMVFEAIDKGRLTLTQRLPVSSHAAAMSPSKLNLRPGDTIQVEDAIYAVATKSANDAAVVLAEALGSGSETQFARIMTERAHQIGMKNSQFRNASGLPNRYQASSARDMATLARVLLARYPEYYHYFSTRKFTYNGVTHINHNKLLGKYSGMDGIKTGFINASGFNLVASAERDGRRLIGVIFGGTSSQARNDKMVKLLDAGFADASKRKIRLASNDPSRRASKTTPKTPEPVKAPEKIQEKAPEKPKTAPEPAVTTESEAQTPETATTAMASSLPENTDATTASTGKKHVLRLPDRLTMPATNISGATTRGQTANAADLSDDGDEQDAPQKMGETVYWSIQVGAYNDRASGEQALTKVRQLAPALLSDAAASIVPITTQRGTLYRARMVGFSEDDAHKACGALQKAKVPCMPLRSTNQ